MEIEKTIPRIIKSMAENHPNAVAQLAKNKEGVFEPTTYQELYGIATNFSAGLLSLNVQRGEKIGLISDDRKEWQQADIGILSIGAIDVPRGCDASLNDLKHILSFTECKIVIAENSAQVKKLITIKNEIPTLSTIIMFEEPTQEDFSLTNDAKVNLYKFSEILNKGINYKKQNPNVIEKEIEKGAWDDVIGIIFTSGTTGTPKGVMLSNGNFITQLDELHERIHLEPNEKALCVLPIWHVFQRLVEYVILSQAASVCYSRPIASVLLEDFQKVNPQLLPAVPRVFEALMEGVNRTMRRTGGITLVLYNFFVKVAILHSKMNRKLFNQNFATKRTALPLWWLALIIPWLLLYPLKALGNVLVFSKIKKKFGTSFRAGVAGGGAFPTLVDEYFWALGITVVEGYGLTETSPVVAVRKITKPVFGCIGTPLRGVTVRVVDMEGNPLKNGEKGILQVKGGTVMKGYYKQDDLTKKVINSEGWLDTSDLAIIGRGGEIKIVGRVKDTIVLRGGENVEPLPLENKIKESRYIEAVVVVGQDQRNLGALILPNKEELELFAKENNISFTSFEDLVTKPEVYKLYDEIIRDAISAKNGFRMFEKIPRFAFITKPFEVGRELSAKQELMRYKISELYAKELKHIFHE